MLPGLFRHIATSTLVKLLLDRLPPVYVLFTICSREPSVVATRGCATRLTYCGGILVRQTISLVALGALRSGSRYYRYLCKSTCLRVGTRPSSLPDILL